MTQQTRTETPRSVRNAYDAGAIEWREINPDYIVSSDGRIGSRRLGGLRIMKLDKRGGYLSVWLCGDNGRKRRSVHHLVAELFLPPKPTPRHQVNHKNGIKTDNRDCNLEWVTASENKLHSLNVLGHKAARGEAQGFARLTEAQVREIRVRFAAGELQRVMAVNYGTSQPQISVIVNRKTWAWLDAEVTA